MFIVGLAVIASAFQSSLNIAKESQKNFVQEAIIFNTLAQIQVKILTAMLYKKNFSLATQKIEQKQFRNAIQNAQKKLNYLASLLTKEADKNLITLVNNALRSYENFFIMPTQVSIENHNAQATIITNKLNLELANLLTIKTTYETDIQTQFEQSYSNIKITFWITITMVVLAVILILWWSVINGVIRPISKFQAVIDNIAAGDLDTRIKTMSSDELGRLANAFDSLLDERMTSLAKTEYDHQQLNSSITILLRAVSALSQKDLTIKVPVADDMTGAVSDSINLLSQEMGKTLQGVADISLKVNSTSERVKQQAANVMIYADNQRQEIEETLNELNTVVNTMIKIAKFSQVTNKESEKTMVTTESAVTAVTETVTNINGIRNIIHETEKRIKRLGEHSQEITGIVNIINNIAERTHVLSLNAGMQAASAGDAGKGFMVVANEVQRLAESSGEATEKIATLVKNIHVDTSNTMKTMNTLITQVVETIQQAENAGIRMKESRATTESLVAAVKKISGATIAQLEIGKSLKEHAKTIQISTIQTNEQLEQQSELSDDLVNNAQELLVKVNVFKLPE